MLRRLSAIGPMAALLITAAASAAPPTPCFDVEVQFTGREFAFAAAGVNYYVWHYRVTGTTCMNKGLSHWVLDVCPDLYGQVSGISTASVDHSAPGSATTNYLPKVGKDPTTGVSGLKWDYVSGNALDRAGEYDDFSFTAPGSVGPLAWTAKGGLLTDSGTTLGPACSGGTVINPPVATEATTWGTIKARFSER